LTVSVEATFVSDSDPEEAQSAADGDAPSGGPADVWIRPVERADLLDVLSIERASFSEPWPYAAFESVLDAPAFLVAIRPTDREGGDIVGYVVGDVMPNHGRDIGHIKDLAVRPDARGEGLGRRLLREALFSLSLAGAVVVKLEARESNERALSLYRDEGFEPTRRMPNYYDDGEDALLLVVNLDS
jgi:ribosomal-protein-alanine N-acetyltransferase